MVRFEQGKLNCLISIQKKEQSPDLDEAGQPVFGWVAVCNPWANIKHQTGAESIRSGADVSIVKASIRIRYREDIDNTMRVLHGATIYNIRAVLPDEHGREYLDLVCETGANNG